MYVFYPAVRIFGLFLLQDLSTGLIEKIIRCTNLMQQL
jgi:hypothetical protein